ncbi:MbtH family NRPS accessory protein [Enterobacteriaceae bacterium ESL0689]|nr:MbtH family NRPS accessory protein [Enterobacteriaceae bacterium ESL0689]
MQRSDPFDNPQTQFYILRNLRQQYSLWPDSCPLPEGWTIASPAQSLADCHHWLMTHWTTLTPDHYAQIRSF